MATRKRNDVRAKKRDKTQSTPKGKKAAPSRRASQARQNPQARPTQQSRRAPQERPAPRSTREGKAPVFDQDADAWSQRTSPQKKQSKSRKEHVRITKAEMRRRRFRRRLFTILFLLLAVGAGVMMSVTLLFRIGSFEFQNADGEPTADTGSYTQDEILQTLEVKMGDNLFSFSTKEQEALLNTHFPLLENIEILRRMPGTVVLRVKPAQESFTIQTSTGWLVLSRQCKVMAMSGTQPELPLLLGPVQNVPQVGQTLELGLPQMTPNETETTATQTAPEQVALQQMLNIFDQYGILDQVTHLDVTDPEQVYFGYQDRIRVVLGTLNQLDYKMRFAVHLLQNKEGNALAETDKGVLDMSIIRSDGSIRPTFKQADPELPSRQAPEDTNAPDASGEDGTAGDASAAPDTPDDAATDAQPEPEPEPKPAEN